MSNTSRLLKFANRYQSLGAILYVCCIQYYIVQIIVALKWVTPYSLGNNAISDLGNTQCGFYGDRFVCSPLHNLMNMSFIILGLLMITGSLLVYQKFHKNLITFAAFTLIAIAGSGALLVGAHPENSISHLHLAGAGLSFVMGNVGLVCFGFAPGIPKTLRMVALISGCMALVALVLLINHSYFGLGFGGIERIVAYPQSIWLIILGLYLLAKREKLPIQM